MPTLDWNSVRILTTVSGVAYGFVVRRAAHLDASIKVGDVLASIATTKITPTPPYRSPPALMGSFFRLANHYART